MLQLISALLGRFGWTFAPDFLASKMTQFGLGAVLIIVGQVLQGEMTWAQAATPIIAALAGIFLRDVKAKAAASQAGQSQFLYQAIALLGGQLKTQPEAMKAAIAGLVPEKTHEQLVADYLACTRAKTEAEAIAREEMRAAERAKGRQLLDAVRSGKEVVMSADTGEVFVNEPGKVEPHDGEADA